MTVSPARARPNVADAHEELAVIVERLQRTFAENSDRGGKVYRSRQGCAKRLDASVALAGGGLFVLMSRAQDRNLCSRGAERAREMAVRLAFGRARQHLRESMRERCSPRR